MAAEYKHQFFIPVIILSIFLSDLRLMKFQTNLIYFLCALLPPTNILHVLGTIQK